MDLSAALYELARLLLAEREADGVAARLLHRVRELSDADRGFVVVREGGRYAQKLDVDYERSALSAEERRFSRTLVAEAIDARRVVALERPADNPRFADQDSVVHLGDRSVRVAPLVDGDDVVGALYLERMRGPFAPQVAGLLAETGQMAGAVIRRALEREALVSRNRDLERDLFAQHDFRGIVTRDDRMLALLRTVAQIADSGASVLVRGETGTGKELVARAVHLNSGRRRRPFVIVHCAALPANLLESELFGHARGAFTGADRDRAGRIAQADGGTLFLDEIAEVPVDAQAKLLRVLQSGEVQRVGSDQLVKVDVRVVAATHQDLDALMAAGRFRRDLYYRLKVVELVVPPLRERPGDVLPLAEAFLERFARGIRRRLTLRAERTLAAHPFPGNVRELEHIIERACLLAGGADIDLDALPPEVGRVDDLSTQPDPKFRRWDAAELAAARDAAVADVEREFVIGLLERAGGNVSQAARDSGVNRTHLQRLLARYR